MGAEWQEAQYDGPVEKGEIAYFVLFLSSFGLYK